MKTFLLKTINKNEAEYEKSFNSTKNLDENLGSKYMIKCLTQINVFHSNENS